MCCLSGCLTSSAYIIAIGDIHTSHMSNSVNCITLLTPYSVVRFTIDNHKFKVIANDLVPIVPYETTSVNIAIGQRYDIVITADQEIGNYWLRAVWQQTCARNTNLASDQLGVIRYVGATDGDPTTTKWSGLPDNCQDESPSNLKPHVPIDVGSLVSQNVLKLGTARSPEGFFQWTVNSSSLVLDWENPTALKLLNGDNVFPTPYNVYNVPQKNQWVYWAIQNSGPAINHPIHLHVCFQSFSSIPNLTNHISKGHDFQVLASAESSTFVPGVTPLNTANPVRRDVATLPKGGYLVIGFFTDNPGSWLIHCHIAWHASQGLSLQFVERQDEIVGTSIKNPNGLKSQCADWGSWYNSPASVFKQDDSGI